jgi:hypothetical protein
MIKLIGKLACKLGFHNYQRKRIKVVGRRAVYFPHMGVREVWHREAVCTRCGEWNAWAFPSNELGDWISGGKVKLPPTEYFYERAMKRSAEIKAGLDTPPNMLEGRTLRLDPCRGCTKSGAACHNCKFGGP